MTDKELTVVLETIETWAGPHLTNMPQGVAAVLVMELSDKLYSTNYPRPARKQAEYLRFWAIQNTIRQRRVFPK